MRTANEITFEIAEKIQGYGIQRITHGHRLWVSADGESVQISYSKYQSTKGFYCTEPRLMITEHGNGYLEADMLTIAMWVERECGF